MRIFVKLAKQNVYFFIKVLQLLNICQKKHHQSFSCIKSTYVKHFEMLLQQEIVMAHGHRHIILYWDAFFEVKHNRIIHKCNVLVSSLVEIEDEKWDPQ